MKLRHLRLLAGTFPHDRREHASAPSEHGSDSAVAGLCVGAQTLGPYPMGPLAAD